ncbi:DUF2889 domain-containing protein [Variovorax sp. Sphag1AA]|uniref:DUF2889 domain-containing protein n=1 Tax=Variovorax sp. Sphag1AA TaxID=2587027 RepID=UPI0017D02B9C|nr:DUF2889 domain-containing protein [Variovorax sp. Sphag1AA]MBB3178329.1 hypothetical protein [Variovorax sp. Sphag1AA]
MQLERDQAMAQGRRLLHTRQVQCTGYLRDDGLFDVEATMKDISPDGTEMFFKRLSAGEALHDMRLVVSFDTDMVIRQVQAHTVAAPTPYCGDSNARYQELVGLKIGPGFSKKVKSLFGGAQGCTHLTELLGPLATTAIQTWFSLWRETNIISEAHRKEGPLPRPMLVDSCQAYRIDGQAMQLLWPPHRRAA